MEPYNTRAKDIVDSDSLKVRNYMEQTMNLTIICLLRKETETIFLWALGNSRAEYFDKKIGQGG